jgi:hypothetical protein
MERKAAQTQATTAGFPKASVRIYKRKPGPGREVALEHLRNAVSAARSMKGAAMALSAEDGSYADDDMTVVRGPGWFMNAQGDGSHVSFINTAAVEGAAAKRVPASQSPRIAAIEPAARKFVADALGSFVKLAPNEKLVAWRTQHATESSMSNNGRTMTEPQVAVTALELRRKVDDIVVLGPGSRVVVMVAPDGAVVGFDVDWSELQDQGVQRSTVAQPALRSRQNQVRAAHPEMSAQAAVKERGTQCGYYDNGARTDAPLVPACVSAYSIEDKQARIKAAYADVIPADLTGQPVVVVPETVLPPPPSGI